MHPYSRWKYGITVDPFREQGKRQYLVLMNHQTAFDQFFCGLAFKGPLYYVASEDLFSKGWVSSLIRFLVAPIPIKKQTTDVSAVLNCLRVAREGGSIAIAPEGNRTYSGRTEYMNPAIAALVRKMKLPLVLFRIEGGYGVHPRWSDVIRRGKMHAYVSKVVEPEEYLSLTDDELNALIARELYVDESTSGGTFRHKHSAEYLERALYVCPFCGLSVLESRLDTIRCTKCGKQARYLPAKQLEGIGCDFPFSTVLEWYDFQCDTVNAMDTSVVTEEPLYRDTARLSEVIVYKRKYLLRRQTEIALYGNRLVLDEGGKEQTVFPFDEISALTVLGRNKLNIYYKEHLYQLKGSPRFNALKYVNIFYRTKNIIRGDANGKFLGL